MRQNMLSVLFALDVVLLVLLAVAFQFIRPGTSAYAISQVSFGVIVLTLVGLAVAARRGMTLFES